MAKYDIGVVVGRFQVPELHEGHRKLIELVHQETKNVLIFVGVAPALGTKSDPLDFTSRAKMLQTDFPNAVIVPLMDRPTNKDWSKNLDIMIRTVFPMGSVCLYGGRDSFLTDYEGAFKTQQFAQFPDVSGTAIRKDTGKTIINSADFRAGVIYSTQNQYPKLHMTVDVALVKGKTVVLGRKADGKLHFPGGFVDPTDDSLEIAAVRELEEETGVSGQGADSYQYIGSYRIDDWRYQKEEKIITAFFMVPFTWGQVESREELSDVKFYPLTAATRKLLAPHHVILFDALLNHLELQKTRQTQNDESYDSSDAVTGAGDL